MTYFLISNSEGDTYVRPYTREELLMILAEEGSGYEAENALHHIKSNDTNYWGDCFLIIKGEIAKPEPVAKTTEWRV